MWILKLSIVKTIFERRRNSNSEHLIVELFCFAKYLTYTMLVGVDFFLVIRIAQNELTFITTK